MINSLKSKITQIILAAAFALSAIVAIPAIASAQPDIQSNLCSGASSLQFGQERSCDTDDPQGQVNKLVTQIINIFSVLVGIVAVIMIIYGGFRYITSGGESGNVTTAKNTILYAIIGLVIVALAQFVVKFILSKATGLGS